MAGGKLSPRQKMINMMYLVLTALLALNVTKEVINAFVTINQSVELSNNNIEKKNNATYQAFAQAMSVDAAKYADVNKRAANVKKASADLNKFIEETKIKLVRQSEKLGAEDSTPSLPHMENKEDYDTPTHIMIGEDDHEGRGGVAFEIKKKLDDYKKVIVSNAPDASKDEYKKMLEQLINTADPAKVEDGKRTWELMSFYHNPVVATVALLSKFQTDIRNAESQVTEDLLASVDANIVKLDKLNAKVIPNSTVVTIGSDFQADVFLSATSSTMAPEVFIGATYDSTTKQMKGGSTNPLPVEGGYAKYTDRPSSEGEKKWEGVIRVKKPDGSYDHYPFKSSYVAQKPNSVVSAEKMNVLYIGVDNPMAISVPGVSTDKVKVSASGAGLALRPNPAAGAGHYMATVTTVGKAVISVSAEIGGKVLPMGTFEYRVKKVPDPVATIANMKGGPVNKNLIAAATLIPTLENFDFELFFKITGFKMTIVRKGKDPYEKEAVGNQLSQEMRDQVAALRTGDKIFFEFIKAKMATGADQSTRNLSPMSFTIQ
jgi:gliding motility-associated protein GldM